MSYTTSISIYLHSSASVWLQLRLWSCVTAKTSFVVLICFLGVCIFRARVSLPALIILIAQWFLQCPARTSEREDGRLQEGEFPSISQTEIYGGASSVNRACLKTSVQAVCPALSRERKKSTSRGQFLPRTADAFVAGSGGWGWAPASCQVPGAGCADVSPRWLEVDAASAAGQSAKRFLLTHLLVVSSCEEFSCAFSGYQHEDPLGLSWSRRAACFLPDPRLESLVPWLSGSVQHPHQKAARQTCLLQ